MLTAAGRLDEGNYDAERVAGPASQGLVGDYFMRNDKVRVVVQAPDRAIGPCPFGGNVIDADRVAAPAGDQLGEVSAFLQLGRTFAFDRAEVVRDGSKGGPAVLRFYGHDAKNDYIDVVGPGRLRARRSQDDYRADVDLQLQAAVTYILMPGETQAARHLHHVQRLERRRDDDLGHAQRHRRAASSRSIRIGGFGEAQISDVVAGGTPPGAYAALLGRGIAYGLVPPGDTTAAFPVAGVDVEIQGVERAVRRARRRRARRSTIKKGGTATREVDLLVASDVADVTAQALGGAAAGDDAVLRHHASRARACSSSSGSDARHRRHRRQPTATTPARCPTATTPSRPRATAIAARRRGAVAARRGGDGRSGGAGGGAARLHHQGRGGRADPGQDQRRRRAAERARSPLPRHDEGSDAVRPRRRRALARRRLVARRSVGPSDRARARPLSRGHLARAGVEPLRADRRSCRPAGMRVDAVLDHVAPTPGYVACDFHQHTYMSPDAPVPPEDRVISYLADGVDFISSSEHDVHFDYSPLLDALGVRGLLDSRGRRRDDAVGLRPLHRLAAARRSDVAQRRRARLGRRRERARSVAGATSSTGCAASARAWCRSTIRARRRAPSPTSSRTSIAPG